jgi:hypothetical protein
LNQAVLAAAITALASYPRLLLWTEKQLALPLLLSAIFICSIVMWGFVFAWHTPYAHHPVFFTPPGQKLFAGVTLAGIIFALGYRLWLDPALRSALPNEYPANRLEWLATVPFVLTFGLLFLIFAPFDWLLRLCRKERIALGLTAAFVAGIAAMKMQSHADAIPTNIFIGCLTARFLGGLMATFLYLRGGIVLAWWWAIIFELRLLPELF